jgi:transposase
VLFAAGKSTQSETRCQKLAHRLLRDLAALRCCGLAPLLAFGNTLYAWREEIATRLALRNNAITEGFHTKMEVLQRQAYAFRKFSELPIAR